MSRADHAQRRLTLALAASLLAHAALVQVVEGTAARRAGSAAVMPLAAVLMPSAPLAEREVQTHPLRAPHRQPDNAPPSLPAPPVAAPAVTPAPTPTPRAVQAAPAPAAQGTAAYTQVNDPTYYSARSLDVYPRALTALRLDLLPMSNAAGKVRATVLIDETGVVNEVRGIEAAADIEHAARELLLRTRFTPAAKDGRIVKAQVLVNLE